MNVTALETSLQAKGYGSDTSAAQLEALNSVYRRVIGLHRWPWLEKQSTSIVTTTTDSHYLLTGITDLLYIDAVRLESGTDYVEIEYASPVKFRNHEHVDRDPNTPLYWTFLNGNLGFWPRPDKVYMITIDYIRTPPVLAAGGDTPIFDSAYHDVLVWGATAELAYREREWWAVGNAKDEFNTRLQEMERAYGIRQRQNASHVVQVNLDGTTAAIV